MSNAAPLPLKPIQTEKRSIGKINFDRGQFRDLLVSVEEKLDRNFTIEISRIPIFSPKNSPQSSHGDSIRLFTHESLKIQFPKSNSI